MTDSFKARTTLKSGAQSYEIWSLPALGAEKVARLPYSLKILLENLLRFEDGINVTRADIEALLNWNPKAAPSYEISFTPARVIMQDFTGVPAIVDLAAMREAMTRLGGNADEINPLAPAELVIDHSVQVDSYGSAHSLADNNRIEFERNGERYAFLRWGQSAFRNFKVVPPNTGIVHQVNLEYLGRVVFENSDGERAPGLPRHAGRHRLAHHDDQRPRRARLGRRRHRGRSGDARSAGHHADPAGRRLQADRQPAARRHRDRSGADGHRDAAQERRGRQIRRILRRRPGQSAAGRSRHHRQHVARIRQHLRDLPDRRGDAALPAAVGPPAPSRSSWSRTMRAPRACGASTVPSPPSTPTCSSSISAPSNRASPAPAGRRTACRCASPRRPTSKHHARMAEERAPQESRAPPARRRSASTASPSSCATARC